MFTVQHTTPPSAPTIRGKINIPVRSPLNHPLGWQRKALYQGMAILLAVMAGCGKAPIPASRPAAKYVASSKSNVFHELTCRSAKRISSANEVHFATREEAVKAGYRACEVCKP